MKGAAALAQLASDLGMAVAAKRLAGKRQYL